MRLDRPTLSRRLAAEAVGTALLLATVVGSGIMADRLAGGNVALALLCNTVATASGLVALILMFGGVSGAYFNPVVTLADVAEGKMRAADGIAYLAVQCVGAVLGVWLAHAMFGEPVLMISQHSRPGWALALSEAGATFGLLGTIRGVSKHQPTAVPFAVGAYIAAAYWFTASTSFANPAVTIARSLTNTFAGIRPADVPLFVAAQCVGAAAAVVFFRWLLASPNQSAEDAG